jgi:carbonic anhydrase
VRRFRTVIFPEQRELYESLAEKQQPCALFLTCGDSRIEPLLLTGTSLGLRDVLTQIPRDYLIIRRCGSMLMQTTWGSALRIA